MFIFNECISPHPAARALGIFPRLGSTACDQYNPDGGWLPAKQGRPAARGIDIIMPNTKDTNCSRVKASG